MMGKNSSSQKKKLKRKKMIIKHSDDTDNIHTAIQMINIHLTKQDIEIGDAKVNCMKTAKQNRKSWRQADTMRRDGMHQANDQMSETLSAPAFVCHILGDGDGEWEREQAET